MKEKTDLTNISPICYNIITDGQPNRKREFENALRNFCKDFPVFLVINLCTEDDAIVEYYNELDKVIGNEISGMDVLDDLESEQIEVKNAGNNFITYCNEIHVARMAGINSIASDLLDEEVLQLHYVYKLCKEISNTQDLPLITNRLEFIKKISELNFEVFDISCNKMKPIFNISQLNWIIWQHNHKIVSKIPIVGYLSYYLSP